MAVKLSPVFNGQEVDANGDPAIGYKLFTYTAGSSTKQTTYTDKDGLVPQTNPIILDSLGYPTNGPIWLTVGQTYKFVLAPSTDTDPPTSPIKTFDGVTGVNDASISVSQWQASGVTPTYVSATSFALVGDQTTDFHKGRQLQFTTSGGTVYGKITNSVFTTLTTITVFIYSSGALDSGLSAVNLSILRADTPALPNPIEMLRSTVAATATTTPIWDRGNGNIQDWTGTPTITDFPAAPQAGAQREIYPAAGTVITNAGNMSVQGNANYTVASGDKLIITAVTTTTFYVEVERKDGLPIVPTSFATTSELAIGTATGKAIDPAILRTADIVSYPNVPTTSGTFKESISVPVWAKKIEVLLSGFSTSGTSFPVVQIGTSSGLETSGYSSGASTTVNAANTAGTVSAVGFLLSGDWAANIVMHGKLTLDLIDPDNNVWVATGTFARSNSGSANYCAGSKQLAGKLDRVRVTTILGTDTLDGGSYTLRFR
jgi:hypothetical protein